ncbi:uncharacterized protein LOC126884251 isoform X2 [Diabrotica virgifera virgifera]|uniref:Uncharacterized protein n=1 Tax=Diabrotica virgifera virgifera TaxID=50390 RepID=A0ABM5K7H3_DIAVI|nr:uncharacterized protein LOC126884251 isoform X2 [Diabrotica virgifera virgifera]
MEIKQEYSETCKVEREYDDLDDPLLDGFKCKIKEESNPESTNHTFDCSTLKEFPIETVLCKVERECKDLDVHILDGFQCKIKKESNPESANYTFDCSVLKEFPIKTETCKVERKYNDFDNPVLDGFSCKINEESNAESTNYTFDCSALKEFPIETEIEQDGNKPTCSKAKPKTKQGDADNLVIECDDEKRALIGAVSKIRRDEESSLKEAKEKLILQLTGQINDLVSFEELKAVQKIVVPIKPTIDAIRNQKDINLGFPSTSRIPSNKKNIPQRNFFPTK